MNWNALFGNQYVLLSITFLLYYYVRRWQKRTGWVLLSPILLTIVAIILYLHFTGISYEHFEESGKLIDFWLKPAVVALGVPLYLQLNAIRKLWVPIVLSQLVGCIVGVVSVVLSAKLLGATDVVILSMASKSVTTPIAMEVTTSLGGLPSLTAAVVVVTGILGSIFGFRMLSVGRVKSPIAQGLSMGTASHAVGASTAMERGQRYGAYASLGITMNGILTALLTPTILRLMGII